MLKRISQQSVLRVGFLFNGRRLTQLEGKVGRLPPSSTSESLMPELERECQQNGLKVLEERIHEESVILDHLQEERSRLRQEIQAKCVAPAISRFKEGCNVSGLYWKQKQDALRRIIDPKDFQTLEEQIDWLASRQELFEQIKNNNSYRPA